MRLLRIFVLAFTAAAPAAPKLTIERLALHQFEDGPEISSTYEFVPGETGYFSCRIAGFDFSKKADDEIRHVKLSWTFRVMDPSGTLLEQPLSGKIEDELRPEDKNWVPKFLTSFIIPASAPSGTYKITAQIRDEIAGANVEGQLEFHVRAHAVESSPTLMLRNFRFLRGEDETSAFSPAVYHPGEMLWARFDITGYKFGEGNRFSMSYGLAIENAEGKELFAQPEAAGDSGESFYPRRYVAGVLNLSLDKNVAPGAYVLVVTASDKTTEQTYAVREQFRVE